MKKCPKCKNIEFYPNGLCAYCVWHGDIGPGKQLKEIIKKKDKKERVKK